MQEKIFNFKVEMTCEGCSNALKKVLTKHKEQGVEEFDIDLPAQTVKVTSTSLNSEEILAIVKKTGKSASFVSEEVKN